MKTCLFIVFILSIFSPNLLWGQSSNSKPLRHEDFKNIGDWARAEINRQIEEDKKARKASLPNLRQQIMDEARKPRMSEERPVRDVNPQAQPAGKPVIVDFTALRVNSESFTASEIEQFAEDRVLTLRIREFLTATSKDAAEFQRKKQHAKRSYFDGALRDLAWSKIYEAAAADLGMVVYEDELDKQFREQIREDLEAYRVSALKKLIGHDEVRAEEERRQRRLTDQELYQLLYANGFNTDDLQAKQRQLFGEYLANGPFKYEDVDNLARFLRNHRYQLMLEEDRKKKELFKDYTPPTFEIPMERMEYPAPKTDEERYERAYQAFERIRWREVRERMRGDFINSAKSHLAKRNDEGSSFNGVSRQEIDAEYRVMKRIYEDQIRPIIHEATTADEISAFLAKPEIQSVKLIYNPPVATIKHLSVQMPTMTICRESHPNLYQKRLETLKAELQVMLNEDKLAVVNNRNLMDLAIDFSSQPAEALTKEMKEKAEEIARSAAKTAILRYRLNDIALWIQTYEPEKTKDERMPKIREVGLGTFSELNRLTIQRFLENPDLFAAEEARSESADVTFGRVAQQIAEELTNTLEKSDPLSPLKAKIYLLGSWLLEEALRKRMFNEVAQIANQFIQRYSDVSKIGEFSFSKMSQPIDQAIQEFSAAFPAVVIVKPSMKVSALKAKNEPSPFANLSLRSFAFRNDLYFNHDDLGRVTIAPEGISAEILILADKAPDFLTSWYDAQLAITDRLKARDFNVSLDRALPKLLEVTSLMIVTYGPDGLIHVPRHETIDYLMQRGKYAIPEALPEEMNPPNP